MKTLRKQIVIWLIGLLVTGVMVFLGLWQMQRFRNDGQGALRERMTAPAVPLTDVATVGSPPHDAYGRPVTVSGTYLPQQQLIIPDLRVPGRYRVLTALRLADGSVVPVVRGETNAEQPPVAPSGEVHEQGLFLPTEAEPERELGPGQLGSVRIPRIAQTWREPMYPGFVSLDVAHAQAQGMESPVVPVPSGAGHARNSGYALQWWIFAVAALAGTIKLSRDARKGTGFMRSSPEAVRLDDGARTENESIDGGADGTNPTRPSGRETRATARPNSRGKD